VNWNRHQRAKLVNAEEEEEEVSALSTDRIQMRASVIEAETFFRYGSSSHRIFFSTQFNIIHPSYPRSPQWSLFFRFPDENTVRISYRSNACCMPAHRFLLNVFTLIIFGGDYTNYKAPHYLQPPNFGDSSTPYTPTPQTYVLPFG
jgi:hypothetical protein